MHQLISGVEYIHTLGVAHRDLKPENLLLTPSLDILIVDFGLSNLYKDGESLKTACGSPCYAAPEMVAGKPYYGALTDIWSCGVIMFALLCGYLPFEEEDTQLLYRKILNADFHIPRFVSTQAKDLIRGILCVDIVKRMTIQQIYQHAWWKLYTPPPPAAHPPKRTTIYAKMLPTSIYARCIAGYEEPAEVITIHKPIELIRERELTREAQMEMIKLALSKADSPVFSPELKGKTIEEELCKLLDCEINLFSVPQPIMF